ncbi:hypothetical protein KFE25_010701 [Diacronema lutheri]|uniref:Uncharacterized protein n=1 Tax=Diacronema lutheri TaxID=2081491 RepID=A0A8J5XDW4_DIALT|nr:hypothetical protein KFE25_010701 [Diacronema lutheri]
MSEMTHADRLKAMREKRYDAQDAAAGLNTKLPETAGAATHSTEGKSLATVNGGGIAERPSSKVLAPPGGKTSISLG